VAQADRYLATLDRDSLERQLHEYREMGVVSRRAAGEVEALASRIAHIDRLATRRKAVEEAAGELAAGIRSLSERVRNRQANPPADLSAELATLRVRAQSADLEGSLAEVRSQLGLMDLKLRRTRFRGVFRSGERYVVPYYDEVGVEHRKEFPTREEARSSAGLSGSLRSTRANTPVRRSKATNGERGDRGPSVDLAGPPSNDLPPGARASTEPSGGRAASRTPRTLPMAGPERTYECVFAVASPHLALSSTSNTGGLSASPSLLPASA
jgi:hypothetical protein